LCSACPRGHGLLGEQRANIGLVAVRNIKYCIGFPSCPGILPPPPFPRSTEEWLFTGFDDHLGSSVHDVRGGELFNVLLSASYGVVPRH
jgi:hypothetical protein